MGAIMQEIHTYSTALQLLVQSKIVLEADKLDKF